MNYELCLEYGTFPLKETGDYVSDDQTPPSFIADDLVLVNKMTLMNQLFHELFLTIESQFHYIGSEFPEKRENIKSLYEEVSTILNEKYSDYKITIESFIL